MAAANGRGQVTHCGHEALVGQKDVPLVKVELVALGDTLEALFEHGQRRPTRDSDHEAATHRDSFPARGPSPQRMSVSVGEFMSSAHLAHDATIADISNPTL